MIAALIEIVHPWLWTFATWFGLAGHIFQMAVAPLISIMAMMAFFKHRRITKKYKETATFGLVGAGLMSAVIAGQALYRFYRTETVDQDTLVGESEKSVNLKKLVKKEKLRRAGLRQALSSVLLLEKYFGKNYITPTITSISDAQRLARGADAMIGDLTKIWNECSEEVDKLEGLSGNGSARSRAGSPAPADEEKYPVRESFVISNGRAHRERETSPDSRISESDSDDFSEAFGEESFSELIKEYTLYNSAKRGAKRGWAWLRRLWSGTSDRVAAGAGVGYRKSRNVLVRARDYMHMKYRSVANWISNQIAWLIAQEAACYAIDIVLFGCVAYTAYKAYSYSTASVPKKKKRTVREARDQFVQIFNDEVEHCPLCKTIHTSGDEHTSLCDEHDWVLDSMGEIFQQWIDTYGGLDAEFTDDFATTMLFGEGKRHASSWLYGETNKARKNKAKKKGDKRRADFDNSKRVRAGTRDARTYNVSGDTVHEADFDREQRDEVESFFDRQEKHSREYFKGESTASASSSSSYDQNTDLKGESMVKGSAPHRVPTVIPVISGANIEDPDCEHTCTYVKGDYAILSRHGVSGRPFTAAVSHTGSKKCDVIDTSKAYRFKGMPDMVVTRVNRQNANVLGVHNPKIDFREPIQGELATIYYNFGEGQCATTGPVGPMRTLGEDGKLKVCDIKASTVRGCCGGPVIAASDSKIIGFMGIGSITGTVDPKFYPVTNEFIHEWKDISKQKFDFACTTDVDYSKVYSDAINGKKGVNFPVEHTITLKA